MLDVYNDDEDYAILNMDGVMKSLYHQMMIDRKLRPKEVDFHSPVWQIKYRKRDFKLDAYRNKVLDTIKRSCTYEKLGLTYNDLMKMDVPTFDTIRELILEIDKAVVASNQMIAKDIENMRH